MQSPHPHRLPSRSAIRTRDSTSSRRSKNHLTFAGPIVLVIDDNKQYCSTVWYSIGLALINVFIGASIMMAIVHSVKTGDSHAVLCTVAFHFFSAEAILGLNYANGWSTPMRIRHRKFAHVFLQICSLVCSVTGTVLVLLSNGLSGTPHGITGIVTMSLAGLSYLSGPFTILRRNIGFYLKIIHMGIGIPTFLVSSICLCLGFLTTAFKSWATPTVAYILIGFVAFYTAFIVSTVFIKCVSRI